MSDPFDAAQPSPVAAPIRIGSGLSPSFSVPPLQSDHPGLDPNSGFRPLDYHYYPPPSRPNPSEAPHPKLSHHSSLLRHHQHPNHQQQHQASSAFSSASHLPTSSSHLPTSSSHLPPSSSLLPTPPFPSPPLPVAPLSPTPPYRYVPAPVYDSTASCLEDLTRVLMSLDDLVDLDPGDRVVRKALVGEILRMQSRLEEAQQRQADPQHKERSTLEDLHKELQMVEAMVDSNRREQRILDQRLADVLQRLDQWNHRSENPTTSSRISNKTSSTAQAARGLDSKNHGSTAASSRDSKNNVPSNADDSGNAYSNGSSTVVRTSISNARTAPLADAVLDNRRSVAIPATRSSVRNP